MATTNIELDIENITGVSDANAQFLISAQKSVVASIPKNLLKWASTFTIPGNHGGNTSDGVTITMPTGTDSVLDVSRNGFSASEVPYAMKGFIANTASLHLATNTYPKYYLDDTNTNEGSKVIVKPIPTDSETVRVLYVDFTKIDDDCDLRNAVVYHACSKEFTKLAIYTAPTVGGTADELTDITQLDVEDEVDDFDGNSIEVDQWFATAAHFIEDEEDSEIASAQMQKISTYIQAYGAELQRVNAKAAHYLQLTDKYYQLAQMEVQQYIQNNSKMLDKALAMQASQQKRD